MRRRRKTKKTTIVLAILGLGCLGAIPFFRPSAKPPEVVRPSSGDELALRGVPLHVEAQPSHSPAVGLYDEQAGPGQGSSPGEPGERFPAGLDHFGPPPEFTTSYPGLLEPVESWTNRPRPDVLARASPVRPVSAEAQDDEAGSPRRHRIIDGDTLARLAKKYLGDPSRASEIYAANRDLLTTPAVLPLGVEIQIPAR